MTTVVGTPPGVTASNWTKVPLPIPEPGLMLWLDADDPKTFAYYTGAEVKDWRSKAPSGVVFGNTDKPPLRNGTQNGRTTVVFDGIDDYVFAPATVWAGVDNFTEFVACKRTGGNSAASNVFHNGNPGGNGWGLAIRANGPNIGILHGGIAWYSSSTPDPAAPGVYTLARTSGSWSLQLNATVTNLAATATPNTPSGASIPSTAHQFGGEVYEVILYDRVLTATERQQVQTYLKTKWGTP